MSTDPSPPYQPYHPPRPPETGRSPSPHQPYPSHSPHPPPPQDSLTYPWQPPPAPQTDPRHTPRPAPPAAHRDLRALRRAYRWQRRTAALTALGYFTLFLLLSAFAPDLMAVTVMDHLPAGLLLALFQLPVTWLAIGLYERTAHRRLDPIAHRIRTQSAAAAGRETAR